MALMTHLLSQRKTAAVICVATVVQIARYNSINTTASMSSARNEDQSSFENPLTVLYKLQTAASTANSIMGLHDPFSGRQLDAVKALRALIHTFPSFDHAAHLMSKSDISSTSGSKKVISEDEKLAEFEELTSSFEFADAAYEDRKVLKERLKEQGYFLVFHEKHTKPGEVSYYMGFNPQKKVVVIGIKGTDAVTDVLTNLICLPMEKTFESDGNSSVLGFFGSKEDKKVAYLHEGMYIAANHIHTQIFDTLKHLFLPQGYEIIVTGHSLGAGTASILGLLLKEELMNLHDSNVSNMNLIHSVLNHDWSDRIKVLAYATPPIMDYKTAESTKSFITSVVLKTDIIPRASINNLITIMNVLFEIDQMLNPQSPSIMADKLARSSTTAPSPPMEAWNFKLTSNEAYDMLHRSIDKAPHEKTSSMMFVPGKVIRLFNASEGEVEVEEGIGEGDGSSRNLGEASYHDVSYLSSVYTDGSDYALRMIHPSSSMLTDHLGVSYRQALEQLVIQHKEVGGMKAKQLHPDSHGDFYTK